MDMPEDTLMVRYADYIVAMTIPRDMEPVQMIVMQITRPPRFKTGSRKNRNRAFYKVALHLT